MIQELLIKIGLSDKEATMYVTLLRHGNQPTSVLAKHAKFNRGTAFVILHQLLTKGLVSKSERSGIQYFSPIEPKNLLQFIDRREKELEEQKEKVQAALGQMYAIMNPLSSKPKIQFFDGIEGARHVLESTLQATDKALRSFLSIADIADFVGAEYFEDYTKRRIETGFALQALRTAEKDKIAITKNDYAKKYVTSHKQKRTVKYLPEDLAFPMSLYMYDNKLGIISSKEESFAMIIESKELCLMQQKLFDLLWKTTA